MPSCVVLRCYTGNDIFAQSNYIPRIIVNLLIVDIITR